MYDWKLQPITLLLTAAIPTVIVRFPSLAVASVVVRADTRLNCCMYIPGANIIQTRFFNAYSVV
jgi:hypothetical protein